MEKQPTENQLMFWLHNARYNSYKQSLMPGILALLYATGKPTFELIPGLLAIAGVVLAHLGANLFDDYFDFKSGSVEHRKSMIDGGMRARSKKCHYLLGGKTTSGTLFLVSLLISAAAGMIGLYLWYLRGNMILYCLLIGAFLSFFYSAPPFRLSFHGLGELTVCLLFGPVLMFGVHYSACGEVDWTIMYLAGSVGLLVANILYTHSILDLEPDRSAGKKTLAVLLGSVKASVCGAAVLLLLVYLPLVIGVYLKSLPPCFLWSLITAPLAWILWRLLVLYEKHPEQRVRKTIWMGPMECWDLIVKNDLDWFMIRWFVSRNLLTAFCFVLILATIIA